MNAPASGAAAGPGAPRPLPVDALVRAGRRRWLVTGAAGFIGSHLVERLLVCGQDVVGLDNFATGRQANLDEVLANVGPEAAARFRMIRGDIVDPAACRAACEGIDLVLHQAALGSVPRSLADPLATHAANVTGFANILHAASQAGIRRFVYASSSSVYGTEPALPKREERIGKPLSPYAASKLVDEIYADVFGRCYGIETVGLRYFNVFGARQDPDGPYAAVIPRWVAALCADAQVLINGDGETSRDFCYVANAVQANLRAALADASGVAGEAFNVAVSHRTTLNTLYAMLRERVERARPGAVTRDVTYGPFRAGDVRHSEADVAKAAERLGYVPTHTLAEGLDEALPWYLARTPEGRGS